MTSVRYISVAAVVALTCGGCFDPRFSAHPSCGPGDRCPDGMKCLGTTCVPTSCDESPDTAQCANASVADGVCRRGTCVPRGCGDGVLDPGEVCEDGNTISGDGCSADCHSLEVCGNNYIDVNEECDSGIDGLSRDGCSSRCTIEDANWSNVSPPAIPARFSHAAAYDSLRNVVVVFGGEDASGALLNDTWEYDGNNWIQRFPLVSPPPTEGHAMAFDAARDRIVMFGGTSADTWEYDGTNWTLRHPAVSPPLVARHAMAYDSTRARIVLVGGYGASASSDTWEYDGTTWEPRATAATPTTLVGAAIAFDSVRGKIVTFGGSPNGEDTVADTWEYDGINWTKFATSTPPPARANHAIAFDPVTDALVVFGGSSDASGFNSLGDSWRLAGGTWTQLMPPSSPPPNQNLTMVFAPNIRRFVAFGGGSPIFGRSTASADLWQLGADDLTWSLSNPLTSPPPRDSFSMAYASARGRTVMFGGARAPDGIIFSDTWEFDGRSWIQRFPLTSPPRRFSHATAYDTKRDRVVVFGGARQPPDGPWNDTWEFDGNEWTKRTTATAPPGRLDAALAYDGARQRLVMFGGTDNNGAPMFDTWELDDSDWHQQSTPVSPMVAGAMAFDAARARMVFVGGTPMPQTWEYNGSWSQVVTAHVPDAPGMLVFDSIRGRIVLFDPTSARTWEYDGSDWSERATQTRLPGRFGCAASFDQRGQLVLFGGQRTNPQIFLNETWSFALSSPASPPDSCVAGVDSDGDGLIACGDATHGPDPDCAGRCSPFCMPAGGCDPTAPRCGDGTCNPDLEDYLLCPNDCAPP